MKFSCIIIEDEPPAQEKLADFISQVPFLDLKNIFGSASQVPAFLATNKVDLLFVDIQLGAITGLDLLTTLKQWPPVILTTAYADYAARSYEFNVVDYLLKPYSFQRFNQGVSKAYKILTDKKDMSSEYIFVRTEYRVEKIEVSDILYIESMKDYLKIVTTSKIIMKLMNFKKILEVLPANEFCRVHNSFIVAVNKIDSIEKGGIKVNKTFIPISRSNKDEFYQRINKRLL